MATDNNEEVKILFRFYSDIMEQDVTETLWALPEEEGLGYYRIDSIPFYFPGLASDDIVFAEYDDKEEMLTYRETIERSGNSTVWVAILDDKIEIDDIRTIFLDLGCGSESIHDRYFAMEIAADTNYLKIKDRLNQLSSEKIIDYAEPYLSEAHQY
ncbi:DUF4265 domain-containing protein [Foetidibacter luteolus]|uniref:DUF4265 domain-containing protein n=1 Tax=Foetidibacter luteolus TaxID=2608880 RepID=UPI001A984259|nr:DUF4265 domain-containing protein [Foetidibacter luteolus]